MNKDEMTVSKERYAYLLKIELLARGLVNGLMPGVRNHYLAQLTEELSESVQHFGTSWSTPVNTGRSKTKPALDQTEKRMR